MEEQKQGEPLELPITIEPTSSTAAQPSSTQQARRMVGYGFVGALIVSALVLFGIFVAKVRSGSDRTTVVKTAETLRWPVATVNGERILYANYIGDRKALQKFYEQNSEPDAAAFTEEQQSDQVLSRLIANKLVAQIAREFNVTVSESDIQKVKTDLLSKFANDEAKLVADVDKNFGLSLDLFFANIVKPAILEQNLTKTFETNPDMGKEFTEEQIKARHILFQVKTDDDDAKIKAQAQKVLNRIKKGEDFAKLAKQYGSDGTKDSGGDLGWFGRGAMVPEFEQVAFALAAGELKPDLVKTQFGYHIIKVDEKKTVKNFRAFMNDRLDNAKIKIYGNIHNPFAEYFEQKKAQNSGQVNNTANTNIDNAAEVELKTDEPVEVSE